MDGNIIFGRRDRKERCQGPGRGGLVCTASVGRKAVRWGRALLVLGQVLLPPETGASLSSGRRCGHGDKW